MPHFAALGSVFTHPARMLERHAFPPADVVEIDIQLVAADPDGEPRKALGQEAERHAGYESQLSKHLFLRSTPNPAVKADA